MAKNKETVDKLQEDFGTIPETHDTTEVAGKDTDGVNTSEVYEGGGSEYPDDNQKESKAEELKETGVEESTVFYCSEYKDLTVEIEAPKVDVINGKRIYNNGLTVKFERGYLKTDDVKVIEHMRAHPWYGLKILEATSNQKYEEGLDEQDFGGYNSDYL